MGWGGALLGGIIGGILGGGFAGAAVGAGIGAILIRGRKKDHDGRLDVCLFRSFGRLAKSDGFVSREEADFV